MSGRKTTVRATWPDAVMMFGTSYRDWDDQLAEYCLSFKRPMPTIEVADVAWIGFGGLKWCQWESFQLQLDHEGKGRKLSDFVFRPPTQRELNKLRKAFEL